MDQGTALPQDNIKASQALVIFCPTNINNLFKGRKSGILVKQRFRTSGKCLEGRNFIRHRGLVRRPLENV
jgi:hypothetical protein